MSWNYVPYSPTYRSALLAIFRANAPKYFAPSDISEFAQYLDHQADAHFWVVLSQQQPIGCGGAYVTMNKIGIAWVLFAPGTIGPGKLLKTSRQFLHHLLTPFTAYAHLPVEVHTTPRLEHLFSRLGFTTIYRIENGFGTGLDEVKMQATFPAIPAPPHR